MFYKQKNKNFKKGFTLIEMMVAVALFSIVMTISVGSLLSLVDANRKAQSLKSVMNNLNFALENMSRTMRVGTNYDCGSVGSPLDCAVSGSNRINFEDSSGINVVYRYNSGSQGIERSVDSEPFLSITAPEVRIEDLRFYVTGASSFDNFQPKVVMTIRGFAGVNEKVKTNFNLQTAISQRVLDLPL